MTIITTINKTGLNNILYTKNMCFKRYINFSRENYDQEISENKCNI